MTTNDIEMRVDIDIAQAKAELESLKRAVTSFAQDVKASANDFNFTVRAQFDDATARAAIKAFYSSLHDEALRISVDIDGKAATASLLMMREAVQSLASVTATASPILRQYNDELERTRASALGAAAAIQQVAGEQRQISAPHHNAGQQQTPPPTNENDGSAWRKHALAVAGVTQEYSGLSARLLATKSAMAILTAAAVGAVPVLTQLGAAYGLAFGTALSTTNVAMMSKELEHLSQTTNASKQALQEWRLAGRFTGLEAELGELGDIGNIFTELNEKMEALGTDKGKELADELARIGLTAQEIKRLKPEDGLMRIGEALEKTKWTTEVKSKFLEDIAGDASKLLPLLTQNSAYFKEIKDYANAVGAIQSDAQLEAMKQTNKELSFFKLGVEGVQTQLSAVGSNVVNTLAPNIKELFIGARPAIDAWSTDIDQALKKFKSDLDSTGSWTMAIKLSLKDAYPTLYGFVASAADFGRGYGQAFVAPMLNELKRGYASIRGALGNAGGAENLGKSVGEAMLPIVGIVRNVSGAIKILIDNWSTLKMVAAVTPVGFAIANWDKVSAVFNTLGNAIRSVAGYFKLISPETAKSATGMQMFTATLLGLVAAGATTRLALGAVGAAFSVMRFALSPAIVAIQFAPAAFTALATSAGIAGRALQVLALAARLNPVIAAATAIAAVAGVIVANWGKIAPFFSGLWGQVTGAFKRAFGDIANVPWQQIPAKILSGFASFSADMFKIGVTAIGKLAIGLLENLGIIDANTAKIANQAVANFAELPGRMLEMGANIMEGLKNGIVSAGNRAIAAAREIASNIGSTVKTFFNIQSPSRLMMGYGGYITDGLALGMLEGSSRAKSAATHVSKEIMRAYTQEINGLKDKQNQLSMTDAAYYQSQLQSKGFTDAMIREAVALRAANASLEDRKIKADELKSAFESELTSLRDQHAKLTLSEDAYYATGLAAKGFNQAMLSELLSLKAANNELEKKQALLKTVADEQKKLGLESRKIGQGVAGQYRVDLNEQGIQGKQADKLSGQYIQNEYLKQATQNKAQILQLKLTEEAYQRLKLAKDGYSKAQIAGLVAQQREIQWLELARKAGLQASSGFVSMTRVKTVAALGFMQDLIGNTANSTKTLFEINKAAAIANALLTAKESIVNSYNFGTTIGGPIVGYAMGTVAALAQAANVASIASQSFGGGSVGSAGGGSAGSVGSSGAGTGAAGSNGTTNDKAKDSPTVTIALSGNDNTQYSKKQVRDLIKHINDAVGDGARLRVA